MNPIRMLAPASLLLLCACTASVYHPTKSEEEMRADVASCTDAANRRYWMDPVAALYNAYDCLEARGYQRDQGDLAARVERAFGEEPRQRRSDVPCRVPCR